MLSDEKMKGVVPCWNLSAVDTSQNVTEDASYVTVSFQFPVARASVRVKLGPGWAPATPRPLPAAAVHGLVLELVHMK